MAQDFIEKLLGRDMINPHTIAKKVNELIDQINLAIAQDPKEEVKKEETDNGNISS